MRIIFSLIAFVFLSSLAAAHEVESIFAQKLELEKGWVLEVTFDVSIVCDEEKANPFLPQRTRQWLTSLDTKELKIIQTRIETFLKKYWHWGNAEGVVEGKFKELDLSSSDFPRLSNGGAYIRIQLFFDKNPQTFRVASSCPFDGLLQWEGEFVSVSPGEQIKLPHALTLPDNQAERGGLLSLVILGFEHVLPDGLDHVCFILALFFLRREWRILLAQSLVFTLAHSLSLGLVIAGWFPLEKWGVAGMVEPVIALSIAWMGIENLLLKRDKPIHVKRRLALIFGFGCVHGMGFAGSLAPFILSAKQHWIIALISTNLGVELAQVSLLLALWAVTHFFYRKNIYPKLAFWSSLSIVCIALYWFFLRIGFF